VPCEAITADSCAREGKRQGSPSRILRFLFRPYQRVQGDDNCLFCTRASLGI
jgi:hypothetical protein